MAAPEANNNDAFASALEERKRLERKNVRDAVLKLICAAPPSRVIHTWQGHVFATKEEASSEGNVFIHTIQQDGLVPLDPVPEVRSWAEDVHVGSELDGGGIYVTKTRFAATVRFKLLSV